jgi:phage gpG-like protein
LDATQALSDWQKFIGVLQDKRPLLRIAGNLMVASIQQTMRDSGSPAGSWRPLYASTLQQQFESESKGGKTPKKAFTKAGLNTTGFANFVANKKILMNTLHLFRSITFAVDGDSAQIGTNLIYGPTQQFGATIVPKSARALRFAIGGGHFIFTKRSVIPARPFIVLRPEDPARIADGIRKYLEKNFGGPMTPEEK